MEHAVERNEGERDVVLVPAPRATPTSRVVGPGRRERAYQARIARLEGDVTAASSALAGRERELEVCTRLERGCQKRIDRLEVDLAAGRARARQLEQQQKRLILALGAAQREAELLREQLALTPGGARRVLRAAPRAPSA